MSECSNNVPSLGGSGGYDVLAGSPLYIAKAGAVTGNQITEFISLARCSENATDEAIASFSVLVDSIFNANSPNYNPTLSGISYQFAPPSTSPVRGDYASLVPAEVVLPTRGGLLTPAASDAIYARDRSRVTRAANATMRAALEQPSSLGIGMAAPAVLRRLAEANQKKLEVTAQVAQEQAAKEGEWERLDITTIVNQELQNRKESWAVTQNRIAAEEATLASSIELFKSELLKEAERRGWSTLETETILKEQLDRANVDLNYLKLLLEKLTELDKLTVQFKSAVFQGWLQAAHLSFSFSGNMSSSLSETA